MYFEFFKWVTGALAAFAALLYAVVVILVFCYQDLLVFPGQAFPLRSAAPQGIVATERLTLKDGRRFRVSVARSEAPRAVVVWFVGNAGAIGRCRYTVDAVARSQRCVVYSPEYPGYEAATGRPSKAACLECAERTAARARDEARQLGVPLLVAGHSLGTFMATHAAAKGYGKRLLLISPPTSIRERGEAILPFLPVRCLLREALDNLAPGGRVRVPTLVLHAADDPIVPVADGRRVAARIPNAKLVVVPRGSHLPTAILREAGSRADRFFQGEH